MTDLHSVYFSLGSNLGDRVANLLDARRRLGSQVTITGDSSIFETEPWGYEDQPSFLNQVLAGQTTLGPEDLLNLAKGIERQMGRQPTFHYGPRLIDIDILIFDRLQTHSDRLTIPHPHMTERAFVIIPLAELAPDVQIPGTGATAAEWAARVEGAESVSPWTGGDENA